MAKQIPFNKEKFGPWSLVIGASLGIGACCAKELAGKGLNVVLCARTESKLKAVAEEIEKTYGVKTRVVPLDWMSPDREQVLDEALADIDLGSAVYSAAWGWQGAFLQGTDEMYKDLIDMNVYGALHFAQYFGKRFCEQRRGGMLFLGSFAGCYSTPYMAVYSATKGFELMLSESLYTEFKPYNVDVTVAYIGAVDTPGNRALFPDAEDAAAQRESQARPEDVAKECIDAMGTGPAAIITKELRTGHLFMRLMGLNKGIQVAGENAVKLNYSKGAPKQLDGE